MHGKPSAWPAETIVVQGRQLTVRRVEPTSAGAAPALFVHGLGGSSLDWTQLMGLVRDAVDGAALDLPGFGMSPPDDGMWSIRGYADVVVAFIEQERRGPVHLIGNSMGGAVATRVAATRPDLVSTLTLISPALPDLRLTRTKAAVGIAGMPIIGKPIVRRLAAVPPERRLDMLIDLVFAEPAKIAPEWREFALVELRRRAALSYAPTALARSTRGIISAYTDPRRDRLWRLAAEVTAPTLLVFGKDDKLVHPRTAQRALRTFRDAHLVMLDRTGHVAQIERPAAIAAAFREHLNLGETARVETG